MSVLPAREALFSRKRSRASDAALIDAGVPGVLLMENAGRGAAEAIVRATQGSGLKRAVVLAGPGNNGGDGLVVARHLAVAGFAVEVFTIDHGLFAGDAKVMCDAWRAIGGTVEPLPGDAAGDAAWGAIECDLLIDALFGTGLSRSLGGAALTAVRRMNARADRPFSVALDIPSGLDADTGAPHGGEDMVFHATHTLTFGASKPGLHTGFGVRASGRVQVVSLGAPMPDTSSVDGAVIELVRRVPVTARASDAHKGDNGRALVLGGSRGTTGAALLSARGAHRGGAGLVTIGSRAAASIDPRVLETMTLSLDDDVDAARLAVREAIGRMDAVLAGPGLGRDAWARAVVETSLEHADRLVLDADALTLLPSIEMRRPDAVCVVTPHPLEMSRLLGGGDAASVNADRVAAARTCAAQYNAYVVLKGAGTVVCAPSGRCAIVDCAEPALGVAGSGDVLAGVILARLAERGAFDPFERVLSAVVAHAHAGQSVHATRGDARGALASEIADAVSFAHEA